MPRVHCTGWYVLSQCTSIHSLTAVERQLCGVVSDKDSRTVERHLRHSEQRPTRIKIPQYQISFGSIVVDVV